MIEHLDNFREESLFRTWLLRIAANHALALLRKRDSVPARRLMMETPTMPTRESASGVHRCLARDTREHLPHDEKHGST